jgi:acetaldehyde dehydrogenase/alcohol dehydrogenase
MAHKLGAAFHIPHGIANALLLNGVIKFNATDNPKKMGAFSQYRHPKAVARYAEIADHLGLGGKNDEEKVVKLMEKFSELRASVGVKSKIADYGVSEKDFLEKLDSMVEQAFDDQCTGANPRYPLMEELKEIYLDAFYGR